MNRSTRFILQAAATACAVFATCAQASVIRIDQSAFTAQAGRITFSEFALNTQNPTYAPANYGGLAGAPTVSFGGWFTGQSAGNSVDCPVGAAVSGCVLGLPTGALSLDVNSPKTFITADASNPTSPVLSGSPQFNGPISILFDVDLAGIGLDGGYFNAIGGTAIHAFARDGSVIGSVANLGLGMEFLGLVTSDGSAQIAGLQFSLIGAEPAGFAIDNLMFGQAGQVVVPGVPEPETYALMLLGLGVVGWAARRRKA